MHDITVCRTAHLGGHTERCPPCAFERYASTSCRNRHCPTWQTFTKVPWLEDRKAARLPVPSFHTVFTLPHALNPLVLGNKQALLTLLCNAASQTVLQCGQQHLGGQRGCPMVFHPWDQTLGAHFHVHCVIPGGALSRDGERWRAADPRFLFPVRALSRVCRGKCLATLQQAFPNDAVTFAGPTAALGTPKGLATRTAPRRDQAWVVSTKPPCAGPAQVLDDVGRSTHRVALANHRIVEVGDGWVRFTSRTRRQGDRRQGMTLDAHACIRRFLLHVWPVGFTRIRHDGFLANRCTARALRRCRVLLGQSLEPPPRRILTVPEWMWQWTGSDITRCPSCGQSPLLRYPLLPEPRQVLPQGPRGPPPLWDSS
jgi:hypothetical protein